MKEAYEFELTITVPVKVIAKSPYEAMRMISKDDVADAGIKAAVKSGHYTYGNIYPMFEYNGCERATEIAKKLGAKNMSDIHNYIENHIDVAEEVLAHDGSIYDIDSIVALERVLERKVSYEELEIISASELFDDKGIYNVEKDDKELLEDILAGKIKDDYER